ncbi:MAG: FtsX-like permease family protein [Mucinivorans sp.]
MNVARGFLFSHKSHSIVNLIARVSTFAIAIPVVALVFVLSLHNGLSGYLHSMYGQIDAPIVVRAVDGGRFALGRQQHTALQSQVGQVSCCVSGTVLARVNSRQVMVNMLGVDSVYAGVSGVARTISSGQWQLDFGGMPRAVLGAGVSYDLAYSLSAPQEISLYNLATVPPMLSFIPVPLFVERQILGAGVFTLDQSTDARRIYVPIDFARQLLNMDSVTVSELNIAPREGLSIEKAKQNIAHIMGDQVQSLDRQQQRGDIFRVINVEKWIIMLMLVCVALIAAMSLTGCMLMMLSEKQSAITTLGVMGMRERKVERIFIRLGMMIVGIGLVLGLVLGLALVGAQHYWGLIKMGGESFLLDAYPVKIELMDLSVIIVSIMAIGYLIVRLTVVHIIKQEKQ